MVSLNTGGPHASIFNNSEFSRVGDHGPQKRVHLSYEMWSALKLQTMVITRTLRTFHALELAGKMSNYMARAIDADDQRI